MKFHKTKPVGKPRKSWDNVVRPDDVIPTFSLFSHWSCVMKFPTKNLFWDPFTYHPYNMTRPS